MLEHEPGANPVVARAVRAAAGRFDVVVALSQAIADDLRREAVEVIRPGVDLERFHPADGRDSGGHALFLGAIVDWKRPDLAIRAAELAGIPLVLAGAPLDDAGRELEASLRSSPGTTFTGRLADPAAALREAAVLLHCADREPYGMALVEALASGVPVVAPAAAGPREITDDTCARLYRPGDAEAAAAALTAALADRPRLARAARARAEKHFDLHGSRRHYQQLFPQTTATAATATGGAGIAVVTVLHDSRPEVEALMASLDRHLPGAHLIAVDSASSDDGAQVVRDRGGTVIRRDENVGYGRGTNIGIEAATDPVTVILNPDVELLDDSLAQLAEEAVRHEHRLLAPLVLLPDGSRQDSVHPLPGATPELIRAALPQPAGGARLDPWRANEPRAVGWAVGCAIAACTETLRALGPFDERAFLYGEDLDLGLRAAQRGIETWFWPRARVLHKRAHSTATAFGGEPFELLAQRRRAVIEERNGARAATRDDVVQAATFANRIVLKKLLRKPADRERRQLRAVRLSRGRSAR